MVCDCCRPDDGWPEGLDGIVGFAGAMDALRSAREALVGMCELVMRETAILVVPSFAPDSSDVLGADDVRGIDWSLSVGFGNVAAERAGGSYECLVEMWLAGPESFHDWVAGMVVAVAGGIPRDKGCADAREAGPEATAEDAPASDWAARMRRLTDRTEVVCDLPGGDGLSGNFDEMVLRAKAAMEACGYTILDDAADDWKCCFLARRWGTTALVTVTTTQLVPVMATALRQAVEAYRDATGKRAEGIVVSFVGKSVRITRADR